MGTVNDKKISVADDQFQNHRISPLDKCKGESLDL